MQLKVLKIERQSWGKNKGQYEGTAEFDNKMKFKNIKKGDAVLIQETIRIGWGGESFWVTKLVDKITPKQFMVGNNRYKKEDGSCVGNRYAKKAKIIGEEKDQKHDRNKLVKRINSAYEIKEIIEKLDVDYKNKNLFALLSNLKDIEKLAKEI